MISLVVLLHMGSERGKMDLDSIDAFLEGRLPTVSGTASTTSSAASAGAFLDNSALSSRSSISSSDPFRSPSPVLDPQADQSFRSLPTRRQRGGRRRSGVSQSLELKRERNRIAASKCREKATKRQRALQEEARLLQQQNIDLLNNVEHLKEEVFLWKAAAHGWGNTVGSSWSTTPELVNNQMDFKGLEAIFEEHDLTDDGQLTVDSSPVIDAVHDEKAC